jgi:hypothetical protein
MKDTNCEALNDAVLSRLPVTPSLLGPNIDLRIVICVLPLISETKFHTHT